jgi:excisionase family DNA binding protein
MEQLYTNKTLAALLQVSQSTIRREMSEGKIRWFKIRGQVRFRESDVHNYLKRNQLKTKQLGQAEVVYLPVRWHKTASNG